MAMPAADMQLCWLVISPKCNPLHLEQPLNRGMQPWRVHLRPGGAWRCRRPAPRWWRTLCPAARPGLQAWPQTAALTHPGCMPPPRDAPARPLSARPPIQNFTEDAKGGRWRGDVLLPSLPAPGCWAYGLEAPLQLTISGRALPEVAQGDMAISACHATCFCASTGVPAAPGYQGADPRAAGRRRHLPSSPTRCQSCLHWARRHPL